MTCLTKPVRRETATCYRGRKLIVELHPAYIVLREKGTRRAVTGDYRTALETGYKILARAAQAERARTRDARRKGIPPKPPMRQNGGRA